ncbi:MAG: 3'-5' exonuclease [Candidatus Bipolaricaulota bacterium]
MAPFDELARLLSRDYVVLDTETTGLVAPELVSVAVVNRHGEEVLHRVVRPGRPIEDEASRVHGLTLGALADKPSFPAIAPVLREALCGHVIVVYNAEYDRRVLANTYRRYRIPLPALETWCAMEWFAHVAGEWNPSRRSYTWKPLAEAARHFGVPQPVAHDALADCLTTWRVLQAAFRQRAASHD